MSWSCIGALLCFGAAVLIFMVTAIPRRPRRNQRVPGVLPPPSPSCRRDYVP